MHAIELRVGPGLGPNTHAHVNAPELEQNKSIEVAVQDSGNQHPPPPHTACPHAYLHAHTLKAKHACGNGYASTLPHVVHKPVNNTCDVQNCANPCTRVENNNMRAYMHACTTMQAHEKHASAKCTPRTRHDPPWC